MDTQFNACAALALLALPYPFGYRDATAFSGKGFVNSGADARSGTIDQGEFVFELEVSCV